MSSLLSDQLSLWSTQNFTENFTQTRQATRYRYIQCLPKKKSDPSNSKKSARASRSLCALRAHVCPPIINRCPLLAPPLFKSWCRHWSELHDMNMNDLRLRNKSTHARGIVIYCGEEKTRKMHTTKFTCKNGDLRLTNMHVALHYACIS